MIATDIIKRRQELWRLRLMQFEARADKDSRPTIRRKESEESIGDRTESPASHAGACDGPARGWNASLRGDGGSSQARSQCVDIECGCCWRLRAAVSSEVV